MEKLTEKSYYENSSLFRFNEILRKIGFDPENIKILRYNHTEYSKKHLHLYRLIDTRMNKPLPFEDFYCESKWEAF